MFPNTFCSCILCTQSRELVWGLVQVEALRRHVVPKFLPTEETDNDAADATSDEHAAQPPEMTSSLPGSLVVRIKIIIISIHEIKTQRITDNVICDEKI